jgi:LPS O-antigen subunit length determinant protein (WzzB/FepE family)
MKQMNEINQVRDDEIDLYELLQTLWVGKWLISACVVLATLIGSGYSQVAQPKYDVSVPYISNIYYVSIQQNCGDNIGCMESQTIKRFLSLLGNSWRQKSSTLSFKTSSPLDLSEYKSQIEDANTALSNEIYTEATNELNIIQTELTDTLLSTEIVAKNMLNAKRVVMSIDSGKNTITFGPVSVVKSPSEVPAILILSVILGVIIGVFVILVRSAIAKRKEQLAKA